jgi:3-dehydroquinate synthase
MKPEIVTVRTRPAAASYEIHVGGSLVDAGPHARRACGPDPGKALVVSNSRVFRHYGVETCEALTAAGFSVSHFLIGDGERYKSLQTAESALAEFARVGLTRTDTVVALGGGVVGDLAGFASAVYLRGIRFVQIPTTLLAMVDSSVGGKTGVNSSFGKNLVGAFHQPSNVLIDLRVLSTLPTRELTAGLCEMVKHAALAGGPLYDRTVKLLNDQMAGRVRRRLRNDTLQIQLAELIAENIRFKAKIVAGDDREDANRSDAGSRKILNLGHTLAHALEKATNYRYFKHGEAVGHGILFAAELSKALALIDNDSVKSLNDVVCRAGVLPSLSGIDGDEVFEAFKFDKKQLNGSLQMILLKGIGEPVILTDSDIPQTTIKKVLKMLLQKWA